VALVLGLLSFCLGVTGWVAVPLAWTAVALCRRDLAKIQAGTMDPVGRAKAEQAKRLAEFGGAFGVLGGLLCGCPLALFFLQLMGRVMCIHFCFQLSRPRPNGLGWNADNYQSRMTGATTP
jgi:hypothetical protein